MQGHMEFTLPRTTRYRYCVPLFHVKPAVGCSLTQLCTYVRQLHDGRGARLDAELKRWPPIGVRPGST